MSPVMCLLSLKKYVLGARPGEVTQSNKGCGGEVPRGCRAPGLFSPPAVAPAVPRAPGVMALSRCSLSGLLVCERLCLHGHRKPNPLVHIAVRICGNIEILPSFVDNEVENKNCTRTCQDPYRRTAWEAGEGLVRLGVVLELTLEGMGIPPAPPSKGHPQGRDAVVRDRRGQRWSQVPGGLPCPR